MCEENVLVNYNDGTNVGSIYMKRSWYDKNRIKYKSTYELCKAYEKEKKA